MIAPDLPQPPKLLLVCKDKLLHTNGEAEHKNAEQITGNDSAGGGGAKRGHAEAPYCAQRATRGIGVIAAHGSGWIESRTKDGATT